MKNKDRFDFGWNLEVVRFLRDNQKISPYITLAGGAGIGIVSAGVFAFPWGGMIVLTLLGGFAGFMKGREVAARISEN